MTAEHAPALRAEAVSKQYTATTALDAVDFDLSPGEVHGLVGENGAGKSTLVKVLTGVTQPTGGRVTISDEVIGWNLIDFCRLVVGGKLLEVIRKKSLDFAACTMMDDIYKAWFAEFDKHLEQVARFELHVFFNRHLFRDIPCRHKRLEGPDKADFVFV